jgi:hypothetical protein
LNVLKVESLKTPLPGPRHIIFTSDLGKLREMVDVVVHRT